MTTMRLFQPGLFAVGIGCALLLALGLAVAIDNLRAAPAAPAAVERAVDRRPAGEQAVEDAQRRLAAAPDDPRAMARLAAAYLLRVRETADPSYYPRADALVQRARALQPDDVDAIVVAGSLAASRHAFQDALTWGQRAVELAPQRTAGYGVITDALVELGRYDEAIEAAQRMVDLRPDQPSYTRVAYLRELYGDLAGAVDAMQRAVQAGAPDSEATAWSEYQVGNLRFAMGDLAGADQAYENSTRRVDGYVYGIAGIGRVEAARGDLAGAADRYEQAVQRLPLPEFAAALGDLYTRLGDTDRAVQQYELVTAMQRLLAANGVRTDVDLALFNADHDLDLDEALDAARAEYEQRSSVHVADTLAWIEYQLGDLESATIHSREALRLGSRDPLMLYRAGVIAEASGASERARELLQASARLNPKFSIRWAPDLAARLGQPSAIGGQL